ncbi:MAG: endonuclease domain-containing protein [Bacillota bacterium]
MRATARSMASARRLRRQLSLPEMLLWRLLRLSRRELRFRKQYPIGPFVADFYCPAAKLVVEIDGATHDARQGADSMRDEYMASLGLTVVRIAAADVLADPEAVADGLYRMCAARARAGPSTTQPGG